MKRLATSRVVDIGPPTNGGRPANGVHRDRRASTGRPGLHRGRDVERRQRVLVYAGTPSITLTRAGVGTILVSRKPAASNSERNSDSERWRPPVHTSMLTSFAAAPRLSSDWSIRAG